MSLDTTTTPSKQPTKDEAQCSVGDGGGRKKTSTMKPPEKTIKCPRCDSPNTKFCYYNNYSLTQPRHFCKTCRRYWTKGGALRNVPIGGGCRKNKKTRSSSLRFINGDSSSKDSSLNIGGLSLFNGLSPPAMDFQLGGLNQFPSNSSNNPPAYLNLDSLACTFPLMKQDHQLHGGLNTSFQDIGVTNNLATSIESLSSINQDLHWKLQQQRLAALFGGGGVVGGGGETDQQQHQSQIVIQNQSQKLQPILFHNLEIPKPSQTSSMSGDLRKDGGIGSVGLETEWFFDNSNYAPMNVDATNPAENYQNGSVNNWNNGIQGWNQFNQYSTLP
ncbi:hypothetical protein LXL04_007389 [Taraxacum kok-saghyz]